MQSRVRSIADHGYLSYSILSKAAELDGTMFYRAEGVNFYQSVRGRGYLRGDLGPGGRILATF